MDRFRGDETQPGNLKNNWRLIVLVGLAMFLSVTSYAQDGERQEKVKSAPLEIRLQTLVSTLCVGTSTILEMEVINVSRKEIKFDKVDLWSEFTYSYSDPNTTSGRGGGQGSSCSHCRGDVITLYPGTNYWTSHTFPLDTDFFKDPGNYTLATSINSVSSNQVKFTLIDCGNK